jgi:integrase
LTTTTSVTFEGEQEQQEQKQEPRIYDVTGGLKSKHTKTAYRIAFNHFLEIRIKSKDLRALLDTKRNVTEDKIIDHITYLKDVEGLTYRSILVHLSAIFHFFDMNDYDDLRRRKIKRFLPEDESDHYAKDRPYSIKELEQKLGKCYILAKVAVLLMASTGMRIGGLRELQIGDIRKIDEFSLHMIWVYNRSGKYRYLTFCTTECAAAIDEYLEYRKKIGGEQLKDKSPLIRDKYGIDNPFSPPAKFLSIRAMSLIFEDVLKRAGVNQPLTIGKPKWQKRDVMRTHGLRKFFINQCIRASLTESTWKPLVGHKLPKTDASYIRLTEEYLLAE